MKAKKSFYFKKKTKSYCYSLDSQTMKQLTCRSISWRSFFLFLILIMSSLRVSFEIEHDRNHIQNPPQLLFTCQHCKAQILTSNFIFSYWKLDKPIHFISFWSFVITRSAISTLKASYTLLLIFFSSNYNDKFIFFRSAFFSGGGGGGECKGDQICAT